MQTIRSGVIHANRAVAALSRKEGLRPGTLPVEGDALIIDMDSLAADTLSEDLLRLRRSVPFAPFAIRTVQPVDVQMTELLRMMDIRAVSTEPEPDWSRIIAELDRTDGVPRQVPRWIAALTRPVRPAVAQRIEVLVATGMDGRHVSDAADRCSTTLRNLEDSLKRHTLPTPERFVQFGRLVKGIDVRRRGKPLDDAAYQSGYNGSSAFLRVFRGLNAAAGNFVRAIGFEWLASVSIFSWGDMSGR